MPGDSNTTVCEPCDGSGLEDPMLRPSDPANGPREACGGSGQLNRAAPDDEDVGSCYDEEMWIFYKSG